MTLPDRSALSRRDYVRTLVAVGGASALAACLETVRDDEERLIPSGTDEPGSLPARQHAWNDTLPTDDHGNVTPPEHHVLVALSLAEGVDPTDGDARKTAESALRTLERAYEWSNEGLLFTLGYTPTYFTRFDESLPASVDLPTPEPLLRGGTPALDEYDAILHLASDEPDAALEAEQALFGDRETVNGIDLETDLTGVFESLEDRRRTGFVGEGLPAEYVDVPGVPDSIPEEAPFFMGFRSGFRRNQATEDRVTIESGPFAGGTTQQLSSMELQLEVWFEQENHFQRVSKLFSQEHAADDLVGDYGEALADSNGLTDERIESTAADAREHGVVGHAQKTARARVDGEPPLLRRDFNTVDGDRPGLHFLSLQREIDDFVRVREAMNGEALDVPSANNGILHYVFVDRRGNYLIPPRSLRALPSPDPDAEYRTDD
ncbi:DUF7405 family protein [Natronobacterium gregoryi]|uniref:Tat pathway signal protein n=2 Tax=Natronobacterium gregoryi TaxID=44930 RepID=L0AE89_NATGS|nr:hypothetical protein [Natronobacterium gregoryi]AFZ71467.1 hypothetical protein Natgr_0206 [Natronobacterium gregoryi SP2]ELY66769.1 hypothetical protein C490_12170 [Natronobacterium gregoryi SP2]PLK19939.1 Tat pathway signal protein [Natronobacterium gregoryi SP2]SFJ36412.1 hypothetical protein SAMN05443661_12438 [Natronobacterium gregoryi]